MLVEWLNEIIKSEKIVIKSKDEAEEFTTAMNELCDWQIKQKIEFAEYDNKPRKIKVRRLWGKFGFTKHEVRPDGSCAISGRYRSSFSSEKIYLQLDKNNLLTGITQKTHYHGCRGWKRYYGKGKIKR